MFGVVVAGQPLQTGLEQIDETHAIVKLPYAASSINHICVFLLGTVPFPPGYGATIHFHWPGKGFQLLGMLSNEKPSAIFRLRGTYSYQSSISNTLRNDPSMAMNSNAGPNLNTQAMEDVTAILGISVETLDVIQSQLQSQSTALTTRPPTSDAPLSATAAITLTENITKHLFNYLSSFASGAGGDASVKMSVVNRWYESVLTKIRAGGVGFLERGSG